MTQRDHEPRPVPSWEAATWAGARREQMCRWAALPLERIITAQEEMAELAAALGHTAGPESPSGFEIGATSLHETPAEDSGDGSPDELVLGGCTPVPLASYLKALGILRLVAEQADPEARGYWRDDVFVLHTHLRADGLRRFLLTDYRPTPILAPWNGGSGFYPKDNQDGIGPLERGGADRLEAVRATIVAMRGALAAHGLAERPSGAAKTRLLAELRAGLPDYALTWLDAAVLLTEDDPKYPPLLGTGGNDGRLDFTNNFMQRLVTVIDPDSGEPRPGAAGWLEESLFATAEPGLPSAKVGQFAPGEAGGPNQVSGYEADKQGFNPWDFVLMLEGAVLFAASATRRLEGSDPRALSYPFTVRPTGAGSGGAAPGDEDNARAELWAPLWSTPVALPELRALLSEGRVTLGRRPARDGLDFARAVAHLGVERGIGAFQRYAFLMRAGKAYFATPLERVHVQRNPAAALIDDLDRNGWLTRFRAHARRDGANRVVSLARRLEDTLFALAGARDDRGPLLRRLLALLGEIEGYLACSPKAREACSPVPMLQSGWLTGADDGSPEMALAAALAGLHARGHGDRDWRLPMRAHLAPIRPGSRPAWDADAERDVLWQPNSDLSDNLAAALHRRLLVAERAELPDKPLRAARRAGLADIADWLAGGIDEARLAALLPGLMLVRLPAGTSPRGEREAPLPAAYRLLKPLFATDEQLHRAGLLPAGRSLPLPAAIVRRLETGDVAGAVEHAERRLRAAGIRVAQARVGTAGIDGRRLLAALTVPIGNKALASLLPQALRPKTESEDRTTSTQEQ